MALSLLGCAACDGVPFTTASKTTKPFSATAKSISVGSPTMATSTFGIMGNIQEIPFLPLVSSSAVPAKMIL